MKGRSKEGDEAERTMLIPPLHFFFLARLRLPSHDQTIGRLELVGLSIDDCYAGVVLVNLVRESGRSSDTVRLLDRRKPR